MKLFISKTIVAGCLLLFVMLQACTVTRSRCNQLYPPVVIHTTDTFLQVRQTLLHDTTYVPAEVSELDFYFEADSNYNVQLLKPQTGIKGKRSSLNYSVQRNQKVLKASVRCKCDSLNIYHVFKSADTALKIYSREIKINRVEVSRPLTWWQTTKLAWGGYAIGIHLCLLLLLLAYIAWRVFKVATPQGAAVAATGSALSQFFKLFKK